MKPLEGIKVVELATMIATPSCGRFLAYLGAEVIKVESLTGEPYRTINYFTNGYKAVFTELNTQKKSVVFNVKDPEVNSYMRKLISTADVFLTNVREASLERLGFTYEELAKDNPKLVYAHFSGYGRKGPLAGMPGYDSTTFATRSGLYREFVSPDSEPVTHIPGLGDMTSGLALAANILAALYQREKTGKGDRVECSLNQVSTWVLMMPMLYAQFNQWFCRKKDDPMDITGTSMECRDGKWILYASGTIKQFKAILTALGLTELLDDPKCATYQLALINTPYIAPFFIKRFKEKDSEEWLKIFREHDIPCELHGYTKNMSVDEQLIANDFITAYELGDRTVMFPNPPVSMESQDLVSSQPGPEMGESTKDVLLSLGCSEKNIGQMAERKAVILR